MQYKYMLTLVKLYKDKKKYIDYDHFIKDVIMKSLKQAEEKLVPKTAVSENATKCAPRSPGRPSARGRVPRKRHPSARRRVRLVHEGRRLGAVVHTDAGSSEDAGKGHQVLDVTTHLNNYQNQDAAQDIHPCFTDSSSSFSSASVSSFFLSRLLLSRPFLLLPFCPRTILRTVRQRAPTPTAPADEAATELSSEGVVECWEEGAENRLKGFSKGSSRSWSKRCLSGDACTHGLKSSNRTVFVCSLHRTIPNNFLNFRRSWIPKLDSEFVRDRYIPSQMSQIRLLHTY